MPQYYYHYTNEVGAQHIIRDGKIKASLGYMTGGDTASGNGVYVTEMKPGKHSQAEIAMNNWMTASPDAIRRTECYFVLDIPDDLVEDTSTDGRNIFLYGSKKDLHLHKHPWWLMNFHNDNEVIASYRYLLASLGPANCMYPDQLGTYYIIDETINGRPVYKSIGDSFLFMDSDGQWIVREGDFKGEEAGIYQRSNYSLGPNSNEKWEYYDYDEGEWLSDDTTFKCHGWQM